MQQRVTAVLVAREGAEYLGRTLAALAAQTRSPETVVAVDVHSGDAGRDRLAASSAHHLVGAPEGTPFGRAAALGVEQAEPSASENEWLWLLAHDNAPDPDALAQLLGAVEIAPSVAVAGPKLMRWEHPDVIAEFGESMTRLGASVPLVAGELDQAQHDVQHDVLGVAAGGMLVRRTLWTELGGFDPALTSIDAALDFSVRARLAGHRVITVPGARVASAGGPEHFDRTKVRESRRARLARTAQLHRRLVYAPAAAVPLHWLSLVPLAVLRSVLHLIGKRPGSVVAEFRAALRVAMSLGAVARARRRLRRSRTVGWGAVAPLRMTRREVRERLAEPAPEDPAASADGAPPVWAEEPVGFVSGGGLWVAVAAAVVGLVLFGRLLGQDTVSGGGLLPLSADVGGLWSNVGWGWRDLGVGSTGAADPFAAVLAVLGTLTFWNPSTVVVLLHLAALPLASVAAWFCARRVSVRRWLPAIAAAVWAVAPPLLAALAAGRLGAVLVHLLLPWLVLAALAAPRSWAASAGAALLFAAVAASAPVLVPALLVLWAGWVASRPRSLHRLIGIPLPAAVLFAPLVVDQVLRGAPLALLADPGVPLTGASGAVTRSGVQLALGAPAGGSDGWADALGGYGLPASAGPVVAAVLLAPLGVLALLSLLVRGSRRAVPALAAALLGFGSAVLASRLELATSGAGTAAVWPGSGVSLLWLGLVVAAAVTLDALRRRSLAAGAALGAATVLASAPLLVAAVPEPHAVRGGDTRILPAIVDAESATQPDVGTLFLYPEGEEALTAELQRGEGAALDDQSTLDATAADLSRSDERLAVLAGNLASRSGFDSAAELDELGIEFVVLVGRPDGVASAEDVVFVRTREALDGNPELAPVGQTTTGLLWRYTDAGDGAAPRGPGSTGTAYGVAVLVVQGVVIGATALLAVPTARRTRRRTARSGGPEGPADTFDEGTDD